MRVTNWSLKALFLGCSATAVILLCSQLAYVLLASFIGSAASASSFVGEHKALLWFVLSIIAYALSFFLGGFLTALLSIHRPIVHAVLVAMIVSGVSIFSVTDLNAINVNALIMLMVGFAFSALGGYWGQERLKL